MVYSRQLYLMVAGMVIAAVVADTDCATPNKSSKVKRRPRRRAAALSACAVRMTGALYQKPNRLRFHIQTRNQILYIPFPFPSSTLPDSALKSVQWMKMRSHGGEELFFVSPYYRQWEAQIKLLLWSGGYETATGLI